MNNQNILGNFSKSDFEKYAIIEPPKESVFMESDLKRTRIVIDSRIRNTSLFPNQNQYDIELDDDINDVKSATLVYADIPMPQYMINDYFNKIVVNVASVDYTVSISNGDYTEAELATELGTKITTATGTTFEVFYVGKTDNFLFTAASPFSLKFSGQTNTIAQIIGFLPQTYASYADASSPGQTNKVMASYRKNFAYNDYIIMDIEQFDVLKSSNKDLNKSFAIIPKNFNELNICDEMKYKKTFSPPIGKLARLKVRFYDKYGNPYEFHNMDHRFEIIFESHRQRRKYNEIFK